MDEILLTAQLQHWWAGDRFALVNEPDAAIDFIERDDLIPFRRGALRSLLPARQIHLTPPIKPIRRPKKTRTSVLTRSVYS